MDQQYHSTVHVMFVARSLHIVSVRQNAFEIRVHLFALTIQLQDMNSCLSRLLVSIVVNVIGVSAGQDLSLTVEEF